jgi:hypothetical protein
MQTLPPDLNPPLFLRYAISIDGHFVDVVPESIKTSLRTQQGNILYGNMASDTSNYSRTIDEPTEEIQFDIRCPAFSISKLNPINWSNLSVPTSGNSDGTPLSASHYVPVEGETKLPQMPGITSDIEWMNILKLKARKGDPLTIAIFRSQGFALPARKDYLKDGGGLDNRLTRFIDTVANNSDIEFPIFFESRQEKKYKIVEISVTEEASNPFWAVISITADEWKPAKWYTGKLNVDSMNNNASTIEYDPEDQDEKLIAGQTTRLGMGMSLRNVRTSSILSGIASRLPALPDVVTSTFSKVRSFLPFLETETGDWAVRAGRSVPRKMGLNWDPKVHCWELSDVPVEDKRIPAGTEVPLQGIPPANAERNW